MPIEVRWQQPDRVIYVEGSGEVTFEEIQQYNDTMTAYIRSGTRPVYIVAKAANIEKFPLNITLVGKMMPYNHEPNLGKVVFISTSSPLAKFFASLIAQTAGLEFKTVNSMDEALDFLNKVDATILKEQA